MAHEDKLREYLKRVTLELADTRRQLAEAEAGRSEAIAIVGMACRFPGSPDLDGYWDLLSNGRDAVADDVPDARFDLDPYTALGVYTRRGAFLSDIAGWDSEFFGAPPREALRMDPQQRLLMELSWEAPEDAGIPAPSLAGSRTGVLVGFSDTLQYGRVQADREGPAFCTDPYAGQGSSASVVAGRLAYHFDLRGPTLAVDTACSSALVAVHLAAESLRRGECDLALGAGGFLLMHPDMYLNGCSTSMLSPSGVNKTFDASADGYVIGEGGGLVVLQRLSDALAQNRRIHAVIRGSAMNQDGRSNGLTAPNRLAQVEVIRRALTASGAAPDDISYVEAHGSGTQLGDAIELGALNDVFGARSPLRPLHVGAVKTNIGHTQAAAGMAGLIKATLALKHRVVPPNLNMTEPAEGVLGSDTVRPTSIERPLPGDAVLAGVSSFGWSGTNVHLVLESAPVTEPAGMVEGPQLLPVSAAGAAALTAQLSRLAASAGLTTGALTDVAFTLQSGRAELEHRRAVVADNAADAAHALRSAGPGVRRVAGRPRLALLLPAAGDEPLALGRDLYRDEPVYGDAVRGCAGIVAELTGAKLLAHFEETFAAQGNQLRELLQFTVQYALAELLASRGVTAELLIGSGVGEYVAACRAGVWPLRTALHAVSLIDSPELGSFLAASAPSAPAVELVLGTGADGLASVVAGATELGIVRPADAYLSLGAEAVPTGLQPDALVLRARPESDVLLHTCARLWELGVALDWTTLRRGSRLVDLPSYAFQRQRFWVDPLPVVAAPAVVPPAVEAVVAALPAVAVLPAVATHEPAQPPVELLEEVWAPAVEAAVSAPAGSRYLIIADLGGLGAALADRLRLDGSDVVLQPAGTDVPDWAALIGRQQTILVALGALDATGDTLAASDTLAAGDSLTADDSDATAGTVAAVLSASRLLSDCGTAALPGTRLVLVTRGAHRTAAAGRTAADATQAAIAALPVVANQEYLSLSSRNVDLEPAAAGSDDVAALAAELAQPWQQPRTAYRGGVRLLPELVSVPGLHTAPARYDGTFLITGGLGDIALTVAEHLVRNGATGLVLTSRSGLPAAGDRRTVAVERLRALGAQVSTPRVDVTDVTAMRELFAAGRVDGVIHAAADVSEDNFRFLRDLDADSTARHFGAKVTGARVLRAVLDGLPDELAPSWVMLFSSTSALLGGVTFGSYAASNAALSALAQPAPGRTRWLAAGWDTWSCTLDKLGTSIGATLRAHAMSDAVAMTAFDALLATDRPAVIVAASSLSDRLPVLADFTEQPPEVAAVEPLAETAPRIRYPRPDLTQPYTPPLTPTERALAQVWSELLGIDPVGTRDNFFDLGGSSLLIPTLLKQIARQFGVTLPTVALFEATTVQALASVLDASDQPQPLTPAAARGAEIEKPPIAMPETVSTPATVRAPQPAPWPGIDGPDLDREIAIIGMGVRAPGASDVATFWSNLVNGVESISFFTPEQLIEAGVEPELAHDPSYVPARPVLDDIKGFDAGFFGISPRMAAITDPQQRLFLEVCWEALELAGYSKPEGRGRVGVFGGTNLSTYLLGIVDQLKNDADVSTSEIVMGNDKDALTTTVSYLFDLHGPSVAVQTFCSTSLVGVHLAVQSLRKGDCELALAGGVSIQVPDRVGHVYTKGAQESHDGHVHTFDAQASGTMFGDGATAVVLKRLSDAERDGDTVYGVIRGTAMNNDGAAKVGYTAPSVAGQARVISDAMADAGVSADEVGYVEAHGTATELGDPIEVAALTRAFGSTQRRQYCPIGMVKTNVGHLNHAAGTAGLIKTSLAVHSGLIPPTLHYTTPNPAIDFANSPFYVNVETTPWPAVDGRPRIAGLNSLGMGGTNVHVVVAEAPARPEAPDLDPGTARRYQVLPISARTAGAADQACERLGTHLAAQPRHRLADVAYSLQAGRKTFEHRRAAVVTSLDEAVATFSGNGASAPAGRLEAAQGRPVAFLFAGVGEQYPGLVAELYRREPVFAAHLNDCIELLNPVLDGVDIRDLLTGARSGGPDLAALLGRASKPDERATTFKRTEVVQPLMFAVDYALASTLVSWGITPSAMLGYSLGEYVAACLSGVFSLRDALALVVYRAKLIETMPAGGMIAIPLPEAQLRGRFRLHARGLDVAALNGPDTVVVAGPADALEQLVTDLRTADIPSRPLDTTHAFHSRMLAPLADELTTWITEHLELNPPRIPYVSNVTGEYVGTELACDPAYWARHMCQPVQFATGAETLLADSEVVIVEIGPGQSLGALARANGCPPQRWPMITSTLPAAGDPRPADALLTDCLSKLWLLGVELDWDAYHGRGAAMGNGTDAYQGWLPGRVPLPTYPFQRQQYWIEPVARALPSAVPTEPQSMEDMGSLPRLPEDQWLYQPVWRQTAAPAADPQPPASWLVFVQPGAGTAVLDKLRADLAGTPAQLTVVHSGPGYVVDAEGFTIRPGEVADALSMLRELRRRGTTLERVVHLWSLQAAGTDAETVALGLHTLVALARAAGELSMQAWSLDIVSTGTQQVLSDSEGRPDTSTLTGPALVIPLEYPSVSTRLIDVEAVTPAAAVTAELRRPRTDQVVAIRADRRWIREYDPIDTAPVAGSPAVVRDGGVYLITGGLGGIGLGMAENLARDCRAKLVLFGRTGLPPMAQWTALLAGNDASEVTRSRVARVRELIALGAEVEIVAGDVADPADVRRAVDIARERFGALHGILHTAGVPGTGLMQFSERARANAVLAPKVAGARALASGLRIGQPDEVELDFLVLFSSITSATGGGPGQVDYCAANAFLDGFAAELAATGRPVLSVDWGEWTWNAWESGLAGYDDELQTFFRKHRSNFGINFDEGWRTLKRALASGQSRVVVSTQDLPTMVRFSTRFTVEAVTAPVSSEPDAPRHPRPELLTPYEQPTGPTEQGVNDIWCAALRLDRVGVRDNFFELGGNSLMGIALLAAMRRAFPAAELPPHILYEAPTVGALARVIDGSVGDTPVEPAPDGIQQAQLRRSALKAQAARRRKQ